MWAWVACGGQVSGCSVSIVPGDLFWCRPVPLVLSSIGGGFLFPRAPGLLLNVSADSLCDWLPYLSLGDAASKILASILTCRALRSCCSRFGSTLTVDMLEGGPGGGIVEEHEAWAVSIQRVTGRLATPLGHIKKTSFYPLDPNKLPDTAHNTRQPY